MDVKLVLFSLLIIGTSCSNNSPIVDNDELTGELIYVNNCSICHGETGDLGAAGAKPLSKSTLDKEQIVTRIKKGINSMPPFEGRLSDSEIERVEEHILTLRK